MASPARCGRRTRPRRARSAGGCECGTVWINEIHHFSPHVSFGGHKQSGMGVENALEGLAEYTNAQTIVTHKAAAPAA